MLQVYTIFTKLGNNDVCLAKNGKGCQQIVPKNEWGVTIMHNFPRKALNLPTLSEKYL
jgi:hypothetical protein